MNAKKTAQFALSGLVALTSVALADDSVKFKDFVDCTGVPTVTSKPLYISKGTCKKLAGSKPVALTCESSHTSGEDLVCDNPKFTIKHYSYDSYVKCYGVAAGAMNDCGTATTACGGSVATPRDKGAWIAVPAGICSQIKGSRIEMPDNKKKS